MDIRSGVLMTMVCVVLSPVPTHANVSSESTEVVIVELTELVDRMTTRTGREPLSDAALREGIDAGAHWLTQAQEGTGHFRYEYHPYAHSYSTDDNVVRQAGALYVLGEILRRDKTASADVELAVKNGIEYFDDISKKGEVDSTSFRCVAENKKSSRCPLGATSLALVGILDLIEHQPETTSHYRPLIRAYRAFILAMQKENGGFQNLYRVNGSTQTDAESPFSNGEALLALTRLYSADPDPIVKSALVRATTYLVTRPYDTALYLWMMAALKDMPQRDPALTHSAYARDFTLWRLAKAQHLKGSTQNYCAYTEGVVSALSILKDKVPNATYAVILANAEEGLRTNRTLQLTSKDHTRAFLLQGTLTLRTMDRPTRGVGGFLTSELVPTERIDYTQHCVNANLQMLTDVRGKTL